MTKTESANRTVQAVVIEACEQLLECQMSAGARLAIPNTGNLIMVGPPEWIAKNVPGVEAMVEASEPKLDEDDITAIWQTMPGGPAGWLKSFGFLQFARAIEAEVIDRLAATTQASTAQAEPDAWISVDERLPVNGEAVLVMADSWDRPAVLVYGDQPYQRFVDRRAGLWFWYPERMHWMPLPAAPVVLRSAGDTGGVR